MSIKHAIRWSFLSEIATKAITPLVFVLLARLLTPEDYGVVAAAAMVISFSQVFWEAGMSKALIQYQGELKPAADAAFWLNNTLGVVVAGALILIAPLIARSVFHDERVIAVLYVLSLQVFLSAVASVHTALLKKDMQFRKLFWVRLITVGAPGLVSIPLAWYGAGYWALVAGTLVGQAVQALILWQQATWRPSFNFQPEIARRLARFGAWVAVSGLSAWFYLWADSLIVGMYLGAHDLGLYRTGNAFVMVIYGFLFGPLLAVLYSYLSRIQNDRQRVREDLSRVVRIIIAVAIPIAFLLYAFAEPIGAIVFGHQWQGVGSVIAVMSLSHGFAWTVGANGEAYRAIGRPDYETKIMLGTLPLYAIAYWLSVQYGLEPFLWARLSMALLATGIHFYVAYVAVKFPVLHVLRYLFRVSLVGIPLVIVGHYWSTPGAGVELQVALLLGTIIWTLVYLWLIKHHALVSEVRGMFSQRT